MEKKIDRIYKARERRRKRDQKGIILFGMSFHGFGIICGIICSPWFFFCWCYGKIKELFIPTKFDKEKFRKWFEKSRNLKHFLFFWNEKNFSIEVSNNIFSNFSYKLKKWRKFTYEAYRYLTDEYEIEGYEKEWDDYNLDNIDFYIKDNQ